VSAFLRFKSLQLTSVQILSRNGGIHLDSAGARHHDAARLSYTVSVPERNHLGVAHRLINTVLMGRYICSMNMCFCSSDDRDKVK
jgi:hypothetical protein